MAVAVVAVVALSAGCANLVPGLGPTTGTDPSVSPSTGQATARQLFGVFVGSDERGIALMPQWEQFLGGKQLQVGHTYLPGDSWESIMGAPQLLRPWSEWKAERPEALFVLNVPMAAPNETSEQEARTGKQALTDDQVSTLLDAGANGQYDNVYQALAQRLVQLKLADSVIVPGWEMNGTTYSHRCEPNPESWKQFFRHVVAAMRSVPGQKFLFDFNPSRGTDAISWKKCYPGDDVVDIIGMDSYDQPPGESWQDYVSQPDGMQDQVDFATERGKPVSYPEWGLFRNGDNPAYIRDMYKWITTHDTIYSTYTDYCPHSVLTDQTCSNPQSAAAVSELFGAR